MRFLSIGEPLVEFTSRPDAPSTFDRRAGGDTLNTAIYLARLTAHDQVGYLSCLGDDPQSLWLRDHIAAEGIDISHLAIRPGARPGLSFISTDALGERSFTYWREQAPFRDHFDDPCHLATLDTAGTLFLSAVTLAVLHPQGRENLLQALVRRRAEGAQIIFDTNYRPALWPDPVAAQQVITRMAGIASLVLPSLDDMSACFGCDTPEAAMRLLMDMTEAEIVLTTGGATVLRRASGQGQIARHDLPPAITATDTTGAGDSFNAAYLAARDQGIAPDHAIFSAARLATIVVGYPGAVIPNDAMPDLFGEKVTT
ncbi:sugar kinase [Paracoccus sp. 11-3]|uniref:Sugar kinase n=1 Tax=Paracoccus amoyensis TaxID=2760093 RepID=A0A926G426_9RHOB|nr:sugar kinase [Paracoccus amoyensis]MBC9245308.1 sugar kinase [Paracoccus amoyensis]